MINYIDLVELISAYFILFILIFLCAFYYLFKKCEEKKTYLNQTLENVKNINESLKELDNKNKEIESFIQNLSFISTKTHEYLEKNEKNYEEIVELLKVDFSEVSEIHKKNSNLLNIINRKVTKFTK